MATTPSSPHDLEPPDTPGRFNRRGRIAGRHDLAPAAAHLRKHPDRRRRVGNGCRATTRPRESVGRSAPTRTSGRTRTTAPARSSTRRSTDRTATRRQSMADAPAVACLTNCETLAGVADTITFRPDEETARAIEALTRDGTPVSTAVRQALLAAARDHARAKLRTEAEKLADDEDDRAEAAQVLRDMETLRAW